MAVKACPACGETVSPMWTSCRKCGAGLIAPPAPLVAVAPAGPVVAPEEQFFAPTVLQPVVVRNPVAPKRRAPVGALVALVVLIVLGAGAYALTQSGGSHTAASKTPVVLSAQPPQAGIPSLEQVVRIRAESSRQLAFSAIAQTYSEQDGRLDAQVLQGMQPSLKWIGGDQSSTGPMEVSFAQTNDGVAIAISTSSREMCAFGKWAPGAVSQYVTMGNVSSCRAIDAPASGWSTLAGGSASDLPPEGY